MSTKSSAPTRADLARELLLYKMREYSEDYHCAAWLHDLESLLWEMPNANDELQLNQFHVKMIPEFRVLAKIAGRGMKMKPSQPHLARFSSPWKAGG
jgi:hypothetical protein